MAPARRLLFLAATLTLALTLATAQEREPVARPPEAGGLRGRVVFEGVGRAVPGLEVVLKVPGDEPRVVVTDEEGGFRFERPAAPGSLTAGWKSEVRVAQPQLRVGPDTEAVEFLAHHVPTARFRGVALDARTGEPLAHCRVKVYERGLHRPRELCETDERGRFETVEELAEGSLAVYSWDNALERDRGFARVEHAWPLEGEAEPVECRLTVGPLYLLDFEPSPGKSLADYEVSLRRRGHRPCETFGFLHRVELHPADAHRPHPWVRPQAPRYLSRLGNDDLHVVSKDGYEAAVLSPPRAGGVLDVTLRRFGQVRSSLQADLPPADPDDLHSYERRQVTAEFVPVGEPLERESFRRPLTVGREMDVSYVEPGTWRVRLGPPFFPEVERVVDVVAGETAQLDVVLGTPKATGDIVIQVADEERSIPEWEGWEDAPRVSAAVTCVDRRRSYSVETSAFCGTGIDAWFQRVHREGRWILEAVLREVPEGRYTCLMLADRLLQPPSLLVEPGETVRFTFARRDPRVAWRLLVLTDAGARPERYSFQPLDRSEPFAFSTYADRDVRAYGALPAGAATEWVLSAPGYKRVYGDAASFLPAPQGRLAEVRLEPGFAVRLEARDEGGAPVAGLALRFAGGEFTTDEHGVVTLASDAAAPPPRVSCEGWEFLLGDLDATGGFEPHAPVLRVTVRKSGR